LGKAALMVSLEQSRTELVQRFFCAEGHLSSSAMRTAEFTPAEEQTLFMAVDGIRKWRLNFADKPQQTVFEIGANAKRMQRRSGLDLVVIDYLGLMDFEYVRGQSKANEIAAATKALKQLARDLKVPVVVLCQLSRDPAKAGERPRLHHLRDSGAIEQDADTVVMLHREGDPIQSVETAILDVYVEKQRNGPLGNVKLAHFKKNFRLADLDQFQHGMHDDFQRN
jgi:replicative DNA helicase